MAEPAVPSARVITRLRWGVLVALRAAACILLLLALYRTMMLLVGVPQGLSTGQRLFPLADRNHAAIRPALSGFFLLILSAWLARRVVPAPREDAPARYCARVGVRATAAAALLLAAWTGYNDARAVWTQWKFMRGGSIQMSSPRSRGLAPPTRLQAMASAMSRARPSIPLLVLGGALLAAQRPLVRLLTPRLGGCPECGYDVDVSKQERCPECGLPLRSSPATAD